MLSTATHQAPSAEPPMARDNSLLKATLSKVQLAACPSSEGGGGGLLIPAFRAAAANGAAASSADEYCSEIASNASASGGGIALSHVTGSSGSSGCDAASGDGTASPSWLYTVQATRLPKLAATATPAPVPAPAPEPAKPRSHTKLLALCPTVPPSMQRDCWCMADYEVLEKLYTGYASKGEWLGGVQWQGAAAEGQLQRGSCRGVLAGWQLQGRVGKVLTACSLSFCNDQFRQTCPCGMLLVHGANPTLIAC